MKISQIPRRENINRFSESSEIGSKERNVDLNNNLPYKHMSISIMWDPERERAKLIDSTNS